MESEQPSAHGSIVDSGKAERVLEWHDLGYAIPVGKVKAKTTRRGAAGGENVEEVSSADPNPQASEGLTFPSPNRYAAYLRMSSSNESRIGDGDNHGVSGGERKRTAIGQELASDPEVLFLDEPTSGLDSNSSFAVMEQMRADAQATQRIVIATIHQPSFDVLNLFHRIILLSNVNTIFMGTPLEALTHFTSLGYALKPQQNLADMMLDLVTIDTSKDDSQVETDLSRIRKLRDAYQGMLEATSPAQFTSSPKVPSSPLSDQPRGRSASPFSKNAALFAISTILGGPRNSARSPESDGKVPRVLRQRLSKASGLDVEAQKGAVNVPASSSRALAPNEWPNSWVKELVILTHRVLKDTIRDRG
ncbi:hypothetical protein HDU96_005932 [Phlyctochytrium bullatum]|nr:hypothetical protein HDU96_005932 [Phlyctochytrium bullatum]